MGRITSAYIFPHPPVIVPEVGKGSEAGAAATIKAVKKAAREIAAKKPSTIIVTSPHAPVFQDFIHISTSPHLSGDLSKFNAGDVRLEYENNTALTNSIIEIANEENIPCGGVDDSIARKYRLTRGLDHGTLVPLYFVDREYPDSKNQTPASNFYFKLVHIAIAGLPLRELYRFGMCIGKAVEESDENVVFLASGDLSHKMSDQSPYGLDSSGPLFDRRLVDSLREAKPENLLEFEESFCESAGECGLRSFVIMFGALDGYRFKSDVYSYEGPFGIGYTVARFLPEEVKSGESILEKMEREDADELAEVRIGEDPYVALAREALESYIRDGRKISVPDILPAEMTGERAGIFVSIKKYGQLRGCIGTISPVKKNIAEEIISNAISSGTQDPRFNPVEELELENLVYSVDVLKKPEPIDSMQELDVIRYGVIVRAGTRSGLLLPNLEGVDTPEKQVSISLQKAGIRADEKYSMERFEVIRHK